jgi:uncharacterized protein YjbI with pentapeptide repeats
MTNHQIESEIDENNCRTIEWDNNYFKLCIMKGFSIDGFVISSDFVNCEFSDIDWYWGIFTQANFVQCRFDNCTFRGTSFADARFLECTLKNCHFIKDNLNGDCDFEGSIAYACKIEEGEGFKATQIGQIRP